MEPTTPCPSDEVLARFAEGRLDEPAARELSAHSEGCAACRKALAALARLQSGPEQTAPAIPPGSDDLLPGTVVGRYVVTGGLGAGAMGVVFAAHDPALDRRVALKLIRSGLDLANARERLAREGQVMAKLSHPNVITVYDVGVWRERRWVAMELVDGTTLRTWLSTPRSPGELVTALAQAGRGLAAAHARGLVHRDFKPDNVLVDRAGRVVVTDFGLAAEPEPSDRTLLVTDLAAHATTRTGALVGTPAYMAPEQLDGRRADARSDQFAFCVTVCEAFTGARPFTASDLGSLRLAMGSGSMQPVVSRLPAAIRRVVVRGLSADPARRFESMDALLAQLEPPRRRAALVVAVLGVAAIAGVSGPWAMSRARLCTGAERQLEGVWDPGRQRAVAAAFGATKHPWADASAKGLSASLDVWAKRWTAGWTDACEATRVHGTQSEELLDLRMSCLAERRAEVAAFVEQVVAGEQRTLETAASAIGRLSPLEPCSDEKVLRAPVRAPADPEVRARVEALRRSVAAAVALRAVGRLAEAKASLSPVAAEVSALGFQPLEADVSVQLGQLEEDFSDFAAAAATYRRALLASEASGHLLASAQAWSFLGRIQTHLAKYAEAHDALEHAEVLTARLGRPAHLDAVLARNLANLLAEEGKLPEARAQAERALAILRKSEPDSAAVAGALNSLGSLARESAEPDRALELFQQALALLSARAGTDHPDLAQIQKNIGNVYWGKGDQATALSWYQKAIALQAATFGKDSLEVASTRTNLAGVLIREQRLPEAEAELRAVIAIVEARLGGDHPQLFGSLNNLAIVLRYTDRLPEAEATLRRAVAIATKAHGEAHDDVATTLLNLGDVLLQRRDFEGSVAAYTRAAEVSEQLYGPEHPNVADCWGGAAFPLLELKQHARALELSARALAIYAKAPGIPVSMAMVHVAHAQASWQVERSLKQRAAAVAEVKAARQTMKAGGAQAADLAGVDQWLKTHR